MEKSHVSYHYRRILCFSDLTEEKKRTQKKMKTSDEAIGLAGG